MSWDEKPTEKQIGALIVMARHCKNPYFGVDEINDFVGKIKTRKEASEALDDIRNARIYESSHGFKGSKGGKWYKELLAIAKSRLIDEQVGRLEKLLEEHPGSSCAELWKKELKRLKEEK